MNKPAATRRKGDFTMKIGVSLAMDVLCGTPQTDAQRALLGPDGIVPEGMPVRVPCSSFSGHSETEDTKGIVIDGLYVNGERITDREQANIQTDAFASDISFS